MKRLLLFLLVPCLLLTGCRGTTELKERLIVQALGVDVQEGRYQVTIQVFSPRESGGQSTVDASALNNQLYQAGGSSLMEAFRQLEQQSGKKLFLGSNRIIALGEAAARERLLDILTFFSGSHETKPRTRLLAVQGEAARVVALQIRQNMVPANSLERMLEQAIDSGFCFPSTLLSIGESFCSEGASAAMAHVAVDKNFSGEDQIRLLGTAIYGRDGDLRGTLTQEETRGARWLTGGIRRTTVVLEGEDGSRYSAVLSPERCRVRPDKRGEEPVFRAELRLHGSVREAQRPDHRGVSREEGEMLSTLMERTVRKEIALVLRRLLEEEQADVLRFCESMEKYRNPWWKENGSRWEELLPRCRVELTVHAELRGLGLGSPAGLGALPRK